MAKCTHTWDIYHIDGKVPAEDRLGATNQPDSTTKSDIVDISICRTCGQTCYLHPGSGRIMNGVTWITRAMQREGE